MDEQFTYEYVPLRGINKSTLQFYDAKTKIDPEGKPLEIGFKYPNGSYKIRSLLEKDFYTKGDIGKAGLYGRDKFNAGASRYVTLTEGELDAISLHQVLGGPVVSVRSSTSAVTDCTVDRSWLNSFERIYLAFDGDTPGREARKAVARLFDPSKVYDVKFTKRKDANEYLQAGEEEELKKIWWNSKQYLPDNIISSFDDIREHLSKGVKQGVPYPIKCLTDMTYGIRTGETVLITAQEKVGKTELMHAIEYQLLQNTDDRIGAIFLEEPVDRHARALAGIHLKSPVHLPHTNFSEVEVFDAYREAVKVDNRLFLYNHFGSDDPDEFLDLVRYLVTALNCRYILLDHISMVVSGHQGDDERKVLDYLATKLEMMVKELDFALIMVSHVNDEGKTRGSRYLTKVADITIGIFRDLQSTDPIERNSLELRLLFNRFASHTGLAGRAFYDQNTCSYSEQIAEDHWQDKLQEFTDAMPFSIPGVDGVRGSQSGLRI